MAKFAPSNNDPLNDILREVCVLEKKNYNTFSNDTKNETPAKATLLKNWRKRLRKKQKAMVSSDGGSEERLLLDEDSEVGTGSKFEGTFIPGFSGVETCYNARISSRLYTKLGKVVRWVVIGLGAYAESINPSVALDADMKHQLHIASSGYPITIPYSM